MLKVEVLAFLRIYLPKMELVQLPRRKWLCGLVIKKVDPPFSRKLIEHKLHSGRPIAFRLSDNC